MTVKSKDVLFSTACLCIFLAGVMITNTAFAKRAHKKLTKENITTFIEETSEITSGANLELSPEEIMDYLERHLDKDARFKSTLKYRVPGYPPQETSMALNKEDFISSIESGANALSDYENTVKIKSIDISKNGRHATVKTTGHETGSMPMPGENGDTQEIPVEGTAQCDQIIKLNDDGIIQMYSANCATDIQFTEFK